MRIFKKDFFICLFLLLVAFSFWWFYLNTEPVFLSNPDSAKFASVARNIKEKKGITMGYGPSGSYEDKYGNFPFTSPPLYPFILSFIFKIFGESDLSVIFTSGFFYIFTVTLVFLLTKKLFDRKIALISALVFIFNPEFLGHAVSGASETIFTFFLITIFYLLFLNTNLAVFFAGIFTFFLLAAKMQAVFYLPAFLIILFFLNKGKSFLRKFLLFLFTPLIFYLAFNSEWPLPSLNIFSIRQISYLLFYNSPVFPRGSIDQVRPALDFSMVFQMSREIFQKSLLNFYTVIKILPTFTNPFIMVLFYLSFFKKDKKEIKVLKYIGLFLFLFLLFFSALTVFNIRYAHPIMPLIIILAMAMFNEILEKFSLNRKEQKIKLTASVLLFFILFQLTQINLGARITKKDKNKDKPSVYYLLGKMVGEMAKEKETVATNLEVWGTWYGKRKTVLVPAEIEDLANVDKVFLSSFSPGTEMSRQWQSLFDNPKDFNNYKFVKKIEIPAKDNYQNIPVEAVVFRKNPKS